MIRTQTYVLTESERKLLAQFIENQYENYETYRSLDDATERMLRHLLTGLNNPGASVVVQHSDELK